jgi:hypothetical protein
VIAEANGPPDASIRRAGGWNNEKMERCYSTTLPKEAVRALAGFDGAGKQFYLPLDLAQTVFPKIEETQLLFDKGEVEDIAGQGCLHLLRYLRSVLLQDSVLLRR